MLNVQKKAKTLQKEEIIEYYRQGIKSEKDFKIGLEWEKLSLDKNTLKNASYEKLKKIIEHFASIKGWGILKDNKTVIGALSGKCSVSLEPGGQFEISLEPKKNISEIKKEAKELWELLRSIAKPYDVIFVPLGITPLSTHKNINMVPKERYLIMANYFKQNGGITAPVMMKETAGVQVNFDYKSEEDAFLKLKVAALVSPFLTGFFANSYIREGKLNGYKSFRANAWLDTDNARCGFFYKNLLKYPSCIGFGDYIENILNVPMLFIQRDNKKILVEGKITFKEFMTQGFCGFYPTLNDYILHSSLTFPDIRLKNCLEIRNHDSQKTSMMLAICAFYKGILYNTKSIEKILSYLDLNIENLKELAINSAKFGLSYDFKGKSAFKIAENLFKIAFDGLRESNDRIMLLEVLKMLEEKRCMADLALGQNIKNEKEAVAFALMP